MLATRQFAYANVPYRIKGHADLLRDPNDTIEFDGALAQEIDARVAAMGADGKLVPDTTGQVRLANLTEKLLVMLLAKLTNFIPEAGIWMNTQRPEWNDANNALVGRGVSLVTLCHIRRFLTFAQGIYADTDVNAVAVAADVAVLARAVTGTLQQHRDALGGPVSDETRKAVLDGVGQAGEAYRRAVYAAQAGHGLSAEGDDEVALSAAEILDLLDTALLWVDHSIRANRRDDGLYHSYNLIDSIQDDALCIDTMHEMLEGQVAALDSGLLSAQETADLLDALRGSSLYRQDQRSYLLYPDGERPLFLNRNTLDPEAAGRSRLLQDLAASGDRRLVEQNRSGGLHFAGGLRNASDAAAVLDDLSRSGWAELVASDRELVLQLFEAQFDHRAYTGRSSTFYGYEGLGSIYWHMVSKLRLAVAEAHARGVSAGAESSILERLTALYYEICDGLGVHKNPRVHGAIPTEPYSHTPGGSGARQPGLTGQVKEDILARWVELGVRLVGGAIEFRPHLLRRAEFASEPHTFQWVDLHGASRSRDLGQGTLGFTYCQTPVVYHLSDSARVVVTRSDGEEEIQGLSLTPATSREIFRRSGVVQRIDVFLNPG